MRIKISNNIKDLPHKFINDIGLVPSLSYNHTEIQDALELLKKHEQYYKKVEDNVDDIIIIDSQSSFSSASFPNYDSRVFLSEYAFYILPPDYVVQKHKYCMIENLYHEALHLELYKRDAENALTNNDENIVIEWEWNKRKTNLISSIHALYVYLNLIKMRECFGFKEYCQKATNNAIFLYDVVAKYRELINPIFFIELNLLFNKTIKN